MPEDIESDHFRKLFVGGLHFDTTEETLSDYFSKWGDVVDCIIMKDGATQRSRGFGFVTFKRAKMLDDAQRARPHRIDKRDVECKRAMPKEDAGRPDAYITSKKIYVSGIKDAHSTEDLRLYFSEFGPVEEVDIIKDKLSGQIRGFAFVTFEDYDPVDKIVLTKSHTIKDYRCDVKKAMTKDELAAVRGGGDFGRGRGGRGGRGGGGDRREGGGYDRGYEERGRYGDRDGGRYGDRERGGSSRGGAPRDYGAPRGGGRTESYRDGGSARDGGYGPPPAPREEYGSSRGGRYEGGGSYGGREGGGSYGGREVGGYGSPRDVAGGYGAAREPGYGSSRDEYEVRRPAGYDREARDDGYSGGARRNGGGGYVEPPPREPYGGGRDGYDDRRDYAAPSGYESREEYPARSSGTQFGSGYRGGSGGGPIRGETYTPKSGGPYSGGSNYGDRGGYGSSSGGGAYAGGSSSSRGGGGRSYEPRGAAYEGGNGSRYEGGGHGETSRGGRGGYSSSSRGGGASRGGGGYSSRGGYAAEAGSGSYRR